MDYKVEVFQRSCPFNLLKKQETIVNIEQFEYNLSIGDSIYSDDKRTIKIDWDFIKVYEEN